MAARVREHATYEDLRPTGPHTRATSAIGGLLVPPFQFGRGGPGGWWILDEPELHLDGDVVVPDLAGWRKERMPELPQSHVFSIPPDWVCEVTTTSSSRIDRLRKLPIYARGVEFTWLVEPTQQTIEAFRRHATGGYLLHTYGEEPIVRIEPFDAVEIDLTLIWGPLPA